MMKISTYAAALAVAVCLSSAANADTGIVVVWQNNAGKWFANGPVQMTSSSERTAARAADYVIGETARGQGVSTLDGCRFIGQWGKYRVYSTGVQMKGGDRNVRNWLNSEAGVVISANE